MGDMKAQRKSAVVTIYNYTLWRLCALVIVLYLAPLAQADKFRVRPMRIEFEPYAGNKLTQVIYVTNEEPNKVMTMDLAVVDVTQSEDGAPQVIELSSDVNTSEASSCREWIKLNKNSIRLDPLSGAPVELTVRVPPNAHGFYIAGITVQSNPKELAERGSSIIVRFLIPILIEIQGRTLLQKVELTDVDMQFKMPTELSPATTLLSMKIENKGKKFSRLTGSITAQTLFKEHWCDITTSEIMEVGIIPSVTLNLKNDISRSLPSGKYKLKGKLYVDGRRAKPIEKDIDFTGDPAIKTATVDAALDLEPPELFISSTPGATRSAVLKVRNASDSTVDIVTATAIPATLKGVAFGELQGEELTCCDWVRIVPDSFTLEAGKEKNVRIIANMPKAESMQSDYYSNIKLSAKYKADGQNAGLTNAILCLENKQQKAQPVGQAMKVTVANEENSRYAIIGRFGNIGTVHLTPRCTAELTTPEGKSVRSILLTGETGLMLPLELRNFSGIVDFSGIAAGVYRLEAIMHYGSGKTSKMVPIQVSVKGEQRIVEVIEPIIKGG
jgi:P pilus assembly chaperone PapD